MNGEILVCTDLDRTLLPNGAEPESQGARERFRMAAEQSETTIAYVTGRHLELAVDAITKYDLPEPDFLVGDVGTSIYRFERRDWRLVGEWHVDIAESWRGRSREDLEQLLRGRDELRLQPPEKQGRFKLSYYTPSDFGHPLSLRRIEEQLREAGVSASVIWSRDELAGVGLLDVLPERATKRHAVEFLIERGRFRVEGTLFAGDSGNDLPLVSCHIPTVLVANTSEPVRREAIRLAEADGTSQSLYLAQGGFLGMNGNYSAGILEGLVHFLPHTTEWFR